VVQSTSVGVDDDMELGLDGGDAAAAGDAATADAAAAAAGNTE